MDNLRVSRFKYQPRQGIIIYLTKFKYIKYLRQYGLIHHVSRKMKYVVLYSDIEDVNGLIKHLKKLKYVRRVELSHLAELDIELLTRSTKE